MKVLITYDVSSRQTEVKNELKDLGFLDYWVDNNNRTYYLPNTTLWHSDLESLDEGKRVFHQVITSLNVKQSLQNRIRVKRFMAVPCSSWSGIEGDPHAE